MDSNRVFEFYYVYQTTCIVDNKIYIGVHGTDDMNDGYLGSGKYFLHALKKYGKQNFVKRILFEGTTYQEILDKETEIVTDDLIEQNNVYNLRRGGWGGAGLRSDLEAQRKKNAADAHRELTLGVPRSEETKKRISEALKGRKVGGALRISSPPETKICAVCDKEFSVRITARRKGLCCSRICAGKYSEGKKYIRDAEGKRERILY